MRGLTLLNSFTWEHSLDNAWASLEGNTPSPQDGNNIRRRLWAVGLQPACRQCDEPCLRTAVRPWPHVSCQREWTVRTAHRWMAGQRHQHRAGRNTLQPDLHTQLPRSRCRRRSRATYRGANEYRPDRGPGQKSDAGPLHREPRTPAISITSTSPHSRCRPSRTPQEMC